MRGIPDRVNGGYIMGVLVCIIVVVAIVCYLIEKG